MGVLVFPDAIAFCFLGDCPINPHRNQTTRVSCKISGIHVNVGCRESGTFPWFVLGRVSARESFGPASNRPRR